MNHLLRYKYDFALSFASEQNHYVRKVWKSLRKMGFKVFYADDRSVQVEHLGRRFSEVAQQVYGESAEFVIIFVSQDYVGKQWPYLEQAYILDRLRMSTFEEGIVLIGKFDSAELPGYPSDIWFKDLRTMYPAAFAQFAADWMRSKRKIDREAVTLQLGRDQFQEAIAYLTKALESEQSYEEQIFALYNRACARSRLAERDANAASLFDQAASDIDDCMALVRDRRPDYLEHFKECANNDDDLLYLRIRQVKSGVGFLGIDKPQLQRGAVRYVNLERACVDPMSKILTPSGEVLMKDVEKGLEVMSYAIQSSISLYATCVANVRVFEHQKKTAINGSLIVSETQPLYERKLGWIVRHQLMLGMELLKHDGSYEVIHDLSECPEGQVMVFQVEHESHTFVADGFVCHNGNK